MGMFDSFYVDTNNINLPMPVDEYQSKCLDCSLVTYRITSEGMLETTNVALDRWNGLNNFNKISKGIFTGTIEIYGEAANSGQWREFNLLVENNQINLILEWGGDVIYCRYPDKLVELTALYKKLNN